MNCITKTLAFCALSLAAISLSAQENPDSMLCVGHYQSEAEAIEQLKRFKSHYNSRAEWEARTTVIREGILKGA